MSQLCSHPPARLQGQGYAHWFKALDHTAQMLWDFRNQRLRPPFTSFEVAHGSGELEGGSDNASKNTAMHLTGSSSGHFPWGEGTTVAIMKPGVPLGPAAVPGISEALSPLLLPTTQGSTCGCCAPGQKRKLGEAGSHG